MKIICSHCGQRYSVAEERIKQFGSHVIFPCPSCKNKIEINLADQSPTPSERSPQLQQRATGEELIKMILGSVNDLPVMPQVAERARKILADKNCSFSMVAHVIEADQAIATKVLKLANSAFYSIMGRVTSIQHAAMVLGTKTLYQVLQIACTEPVLSARLPGYGQNSGDLWRHSLAVAACSRAIAKRRNPSIIDDGFSAGLLHDCGKLILDPYLGARSEAFQNCLVQEKKKVFEAERILLGVDHAHIAAYVCEKWQIPKQLFSAIQYHHTPSLLRVHELAFIVHLANAVMHVPDISTLRDIADIEAEPEAIKFLGLDINQIALVWQESSDYVIKTIGSL